MTKDMMIKALSDFIASKGVETMTLADYKGFGNDVPVKDFMLRRAFGSWSRVLSVLKKRYPIQVVVKEAPKKVEPKKVTPKKESTKKEVKDVKK